MYCNHGRKYTPAIDITQIRTKTLFSVYTSTATPHGGGGGAGSGFPRKISTPTEELDTCLGGGWVRSGKLVAR